jgi:phage shock protein B
MDAPLFIVMTVFGSIVLVLAIIASTILMGIKIVKGGTSSKDRKEHSNEARMIQEIYQGLARMEDRVESLETILLEREKKRKDGR